MNPSEIHYQKIHELSKHRRILEGVVSLLNWDQETYMPPEGAGIRAEQLGVMAGIIHREKTGPKFAKALSKLIDLPSGKLLSKRLSQQQNAALREWHRDYVHDTALPTKFVEEYTKITSQALMVWRTAKSDDAFHQFLPFLDRIVILNRRKAEYLKYKDHPYDALLDEYEPEMKTKDVEQLFTKLRNTLIPLIKKAAKRKINDDFLFGKWSDSKQIAFSFKILDAMGYDKNKGRIDFSSHPFSSSCHPNDSRVTTRIHEDSLMSNIFVILHEGGHSLYEMGLPIDQYGTPLGEARSLGIHESQSRWWETYIGMSKPFWQYFLPQLQSLFKGKLSDISLEQFYRAINIVEPSLVRVEADELTYPMHIILRFELEKALIEGSLSVRDLPEVWNEKMSKYLGITPKTNREGCLQDIHWAMGAFGYFPTYTLGNLYAAHLFEAFAHQHPDWKHRVAAGELSFIREWLHDKIYQYGRRYSTKELLKKATGTPFTADAYLSYLQDKYTSL
jgi:carboxypeptidase Taq